MKVIDIEKVKTLFKLFQYGMSEETKKSINDDIDYLLESQSFEVKESGEE